MEDHLLLRVIKGLTEIFLPSPIFGLLKPMFNLLVVKVNLSVFSSNLSTIGWSGLGSSIRVLIGVSPLFVLRGETYLSLGLGVAPLPFRCGYSCRRLLFIPKAV
jgi:hypothetical protein